MNNMANIYKRQGKYEEALEVHRKSLEIRTCIYVGDSHPLVADSWNNIGEVLRNTGRYEETLEMHAKSLCTATSNQIPTLPNAFWGGGSRPAPGPAPSVAVAEAAPWTPAVSRPRAGCGGYVP